MSGVSYRHLAAFGTVHRARALLGFEGLSKGDSQPIFSISDVKSRSERGGVIPSPRFRLQNVLQARTV